MNKQPIEKPHCKVDEELNGKVCKIDTQLFT